MLIQDGPIIFAHKMISTKEDHSIKNQDHIARAREIIGISLPHSMDFSNKSGSTQGMLFSFFDLYLWFSFLVHQRIFLLVFFWRKAYVILSDTYADIWVADSSFISDYIRTSVVSNVQSSRY